MSALHVTEKTCKPTTFGDLLLINSDAILVQG